MIDLFSIPIFPLGELAVPEPASEIRPMLHLAIPIVLGEIGWMSMGIVDTMMVGRLPNSAQAIGGISLGHMMFYVVAIFGTGIMLGLDTLVSQSFGAGEIERAEGLMHEHGPPGGADNKWNRHASSLSAQLIAALSAAVV